jgi:diguanylate cyclase
MSHTQKILHITDDSEQIQSLRGLNTLGKAAVSITEAACDKVDAVLADKRFDIVILDMESAGTEKNAYDIIYAIQQADKALPIIVALAEENERKVMRVVSMGVQDYLIKHHSSHDVIRRAIRYAVQRKRYEEKIAYLTMQDHLTGLMNGELIPSTLRQAINSAKREKSLLAVYFVDVDHFRDINDAYGHDVGNALLIDIASRLQSILDENSILARLSGNTFIIIDIAEDLDACAVLAEEIVSAMHAKTKIGTLDLQFSTSIGVATYPECGDEYASLLRHAEMALLQAKRSGRGHYRFFSAELNEEVTKRIHITTALKQMVNEEGFALHYQPVIELATGHVTGVEALIRWTHPIYGNIRPDQFIPLAEEAGLIQNVSAWVAHTACMQHRTSPIFGELDMAINISARELCSDDIIDLMRHILEETGMPPGRLVIEITETAMMADTKKALSVMEHLKALGIKLYIDDFGMGYSSIDYLRRFPVDTLKIDRSFIMQMHEKPDDLRVVKLMVDIAHVLELSVIAEGVELEQQRQLLQSMHCQEAQGYHFAKPMPADTFIEWHHAYQQRLLADSKRTG